MSAPTVQEQLLNLADRAEKGKLTSLEAGALRAGVHVMAEQLRKAAASNEGLRTRVRELREKTAAAQRDLALTGAYRTPCGYCGAGVGEKCRPVRGFLAPRTPHTARLDAARKDTA